MSIIIIDDNTVTRNTAMRISVHETLMTCLLFTIETNSQRYVPMTICICAEFGFIDIKAVHYCRPPHFLTLIVRNVEWHGTRRRLESSDKFGYGVFKGETRVSVPPRDPEKVPLTQI